MACTNIFIDSHRCHCPTSITKDTSLVSQSNPLSTSSWVGCIFWTFWDREEQLKLLLCHHIVLLFFNHFLLLWINKFPLLHVQLSPFEPMVSGECVHSSYHCQSHVTQHCRHMNGRFSRTSPQTRLLPAVCGSDSPASPAGCLSSTVVLCQLHVWLQRGYIFF